MSKYTYKQYKEANPENKGNPKMEHNEVANMNGKLINFAAAVNLMDDVIREALVDQQDWDSDQAFFSAYEDAHIEQYGEVWELSKSNPVW